MGDPVMLVLGAAALLLATFLAGVVGFAYGLVALPLLLVIGVPLPEVVAINLAVALATRISVVARLHRDIYWPQAGQLVAGSAPGIAIGLVARDWVARDLIQLLAGLFTLGAVAAITAMGRRTKRGETQPSMRARGNVAAGFLGGFLGVTTSLNGVPPALLLTKDRASARRMVANLATYFVFGNALTLVVLAGSGHAPASWVWPALAVWIPVGLMGNLVGTSVGPRLPYGTFRRITIGVILASALVSTAQAALVLG